MQRALHSQGLIEVLLRLSEISSLPAQVAQRMQCHSNLRVIPIPMQRALHSQGLIEVLLRLSEISSLPAQVAQRMQCHSNLRVIPIPMQRGAWFSRSHCSTASLDWDLQPSNSGCLAHSVSRQSRGDTHAHTRSTSCLRTLGSIALIAWDLQHADSSCPDYAAQHSNFRVVGVLVCVSQLQQWVPILASVSPPATASGRLKASESSSPQVSSVTFHVTTVTLPASGACEWDGAVGCVNTSDLLGKTSVSSNGRSSSSALRVAEIIFSQADLHFQCLSGCTIWPAKSRTAAMTSKSLSGSSSAKSLSWGKRSFFGYRAVGWECTLELV